MAFDARLVWAFFIGLYAVRPILWPGGDVPSEKVENLLWNASKVRRGIYTSNGSLFSTKLSFVMDIVSGIFYSRPPGKYGGAALKTKVPHCRTFVFKASPRLVLFSGVIIAFNGAR
jgi:hypothetical protein